MKILFLSRWFPYPANNGSKIRISGLLKQLARRHTVFLISFAESTDVVDVDAIAAARQYCASVHLVPSRPFHPNSIKAVVGLLSPRPRFLVDTYDQGFAEAVRQVSHRVRPDLVIASQIDTLPYLGEAPGTPAILEELEIAAYVDACRQRRPDRRLRASLTWLKLASYLRRTLPRVAACTVVSSIEQAHLLRAVPRYQNVEIVPNAINMADYASDYGEPEPDTLVYAGALSYDANLDAVRYFLNYVYPRVRLSVPRVSLRVTGRTDGVDLSELARFPGVQFTGYVPDVRPIVARSWASIVPLRLGGGTRLKILEAMALGTPVVSTRKGVEGIDVTEGEDILIADGPDELAARIVEVLRSSQVRRRLAEGGKRLIELRYEWGLVGRKLDQLVERVAAESKPVGAWR
ncbi:MAG TPA: glycosyltransferase [Chloroflexota bacterium]